VPPLLLLLLLLLLVLPPPHAFSAVIQFTASSELTDRPSWMNVARVSTAGCSR
jgi:hypothetical protein